MIYPKVIEYCNKNGLSVAAFERKCDLANGTVNGWKAKGSNPSLKSLQKIEKATKIALKKWLSD